MWQAYLDGHTQHHIAEQEGISQARVSQILAEVRKSIPEPALEEIKAAEADRVARLYTRTVEIINAEHPLVSVQRGTIITDPDTGLRLLDDGPVLQAITTALRIHERVAKAYGLDAPERLEARVQSDAEVAWQETIATERARRRAAREQREADEEPERG